MNIVAIVAPVMGLIGLGWLASRTGLVSRAAADGLSEYVYSIAIPALIISTLSRPSALVEISWSFWLAYFGGVALVWYTGMAIARRIFGRERREAVMFGFVAGQSNTVLLGVPLILRAYGDDAAAPMFLLLAVHLPIMMTAATLMLEGEAEASSLAEQASRLARILLRNPIIVAMAIGLVLRASGTVPSDVAKTMLDGIGETASVCALLAMGMALSRYGIFEEFRSGVTLSFLKLLVHPLAVWLLCFKLFQLPAALGGVATLFAALPSGINGYLLSVRYKTGEIAVSSAIVTSTLLSVASLALWLSILGPL